MARRRPGAASVPAASQQFSPRPQDAPLAPWPNFDRYPVVIGSSLTLQYLSSVFRTAQTGYRREYVDVLDELLERDPHCYAILAQRILGVAGGRLVVEAAPCDDEDEAAKALSEEMRALVERKLFAIPDLQQSLAALLWAVYYGVTCAEIGWRFDAEDGWSVSRLFWVHSRRIQYPDPMSWQPRIWDWGMVRGWNDWGTRREPTTDAMFGLGTDDFPGKFIVHQPQLRGDYPTRDGLGRELAYWSALKLMAARGGAQYVERFANPWAIGKYTTSKEGKPRAATTDDIDVLKLAVAGLGNGLARATLPDSTSIDMAGPGVSASTRGTLIHGDFMKLCDDAQSKAALGQTDTVSASPNGSRAAVQTRKDGTLELYRYDGRCLCDSLERDLVYWIVRLNKPEALRFVPRLRIAFDVEPDAKEIATIAATLAQGGAPVDADAVADRCDIPLVERDEGDTKPRRMAPLKPVDMFALQSGEPPPPPTPHLPPGASGKPNQTPPGDDKNEET